MSMLAFNDLTPISKQSAYELAAALDAKHLPSASSFYTPFNLDMYTHSHYPHDVADPSAPHGSGYSLLNESHSAYLPEMPLYHANYSALATAGYPPRAPSPHLLYPYAPHVLLAQQELLNAFPRDHLMQPMPGYGYPSSTSMQMDEPQQPMGDPGIQQPWSLSGSLDPATGVFQKAPEHPRLRTAQACEKCRVRKAKCSGDHPSCQRCMSRGLICEYAAERKMRGPNKSKKAKGAQASNRDPSPAGSASTDHRRMSVVSIASIESSSSSSDDFLPDGLPPAVHGSSSLSLEGLQYPFPSQSPSPPGFPLPAYGDAHAAHGYASQLDSALLDPVLRDVRQQPATGLGARRQRPPPLDLGDARLFPSALALAPPMGHHLLARSADGMAPHSAGATAYASSTDVVGRRLSMPALHPFSPGARMLVSPAGMPLLHVRSGSGSGSSVRSRSSTASGVSPATPASLGMADFADFVAGLPGVERSGSAGSVHSLAEAGKPHEAADVQMQWLGGDDETPRIGSSAVWTVCGAE